MSEFPAQTVSAAALGARWAALSQLGGVAADLQNYDPFLVREPRLLVPADLQAYVVRAGVNDQLGMVRLPFRAAADSLGPLDVADPGTPRPAGVHLLWTVPAALTAGTVDGGALQLPTLPDRWVVLRLAVPLGATEPAVTGWVLQADAGIATPLAQWPGEPGVTGSGANGDTTIAPAVPLAALNAHIGGTAWLQCYDSALGRCSFHDDLADLAGQQLEGDAISYLVAGWWSQSGDDPLDGVGTDVGYRQRLADLGWTDPDHPSPEASQQAASDERYQVATTFGLPVAGRYAQPVLAPMNAAPDEAVGKSASQPQDAADASGSVSSAVVSSAVVSSAVVSGVVSDRAEMLRASYSGFLADAVAAAALPPAPTRSTLVHGRLHGVPLASALAPDSAPDPKALQVALGASPPDVAAVFTSSAAGLAASGAGGTDGTGGTDGSDATAGAQRAAERLLAAFSAGMLTGIGQSDVWADVDEYEHTQGFHAVPAGVEATDVFVDRAGAPSDPGAGQRVGAAPPAGAAVAKSLGTRFGAADLALAADPTVLWSATSRPAAPRIFDVTSIARNPDLLDARPNSQPTAPQPVVREVPRAAPAYQYPVPPVLAVVGGGRALSAVELEEADHTLVCRLSDQTSRGLAGVVNSEQLLTTIGTAAVPPEVLDLAREALAEDPYLTAWRARLAAPTGLPPGQLAARVGAEAAVSFAYYTADDTRLSSYAGAEVSSSTARQQVTEGLLRLSLSDGVWAHPEGVTMWGQPWRPLFCDWAATLDLGPVTGWALTGIDLDPGAVATPNSVTVTGRSPLAAGVARTLSAALGKWLTDERMRDLGGHGLADPATEAALAGLRDALAGIDMMSAALDGIREQLLGLSYDRGLVYLDADKDEAGTRRALAEQLPTLLAAGHLRLASARLVDAFGRVVDLPIQALLVPQRLADTIDPAAGDLLLRPRITAPARWRFDLVDATSTSVDAALARVDQADLSLQVSPIAGFLLPDHLDDSLEVFAADGAPLGELLHDAYSDAVTWEIAPGRTDVAPAAGPTDDPNPDHHRVGWIAAAIVAADAADRRGTPDRSETESSLSALLRAIDTTLWTVDPFGSLGTEHIAGLVGRPIAVVTARLALDIQSDAAALVYGPGAAAADRQAAYDALAAETFAVRLGEITRTDDGLLGYFVDDDFTAFHVVDPSILANALPSGQGQGVLDPTNTDPLQPAPITNPYVVGENAVVIRPGQTVQLTLLMHPGGKVHLTSGVLPRVDQALARDWVNPGMSVLAPSLRCGPLLIDADKVRLPKVASFPATQLFTRRDTPSTWKNDPILSATQDALLPDTPAMAQEGWVRVDPNPPAPPG